MQIALFGYAINFDVRGLDAVVLDQARTSLSRQIVADLAATQVMRIAWQADSEAEFENVMQRGDASLGLVPGLSLSAGAYKDIRRPPQTVLGTEGQMTQIKKSIPEFVPAAADSGCPHHA